MATSTIRKSPLLVSALALISATTLSSCSWFKDDDKKQPLPGERISILQMQTTLEPKDAELSGEGFIAPAPWANEFWPQAGGYPNHAMQNPALDDRDLKKIWSVDIGDGASDEIPLTAQPVVYNGVIFTLDTDSQVSAFDTKTGKRLWETSIQPKTEDEQVISGGLAVSGKTLYIASGYSELVALNVDDGKTLWIAKVPSPSRAAPTIIDNTVYLMTVDNRILSLDAQNGSKKWEYEGIAETAGLIGAASPAADSDIVVAPLSSGELTALRVENGSVAWSENLSSLVHRGGSAALPDMPGLPVIDKDLVIGVSYGGKIVAVEQRTGRRVWQREIGSAKSPWVAGNTIFFLSAEAELVALGRDTGALMWVKPLNSYNDGENSSNSLLWNGPIMAGGRLIVTAPDGTVVEIDPKTGLKTRQFDSGDRVAVSPVIANGTLFLLDQDGTLSAWK